MKRLPLLLLAPFAAFAQGPLDPPPGPPAESMKTLQEIWDRVGLLETRLATAQADLTRTRADLTLVKADNQLLTGLFSASAASLSLPWNIVTVDSADSVGTFLSMAFSPAGQPAIAYYKITGADLKYASYNGSSWEVETPNTFLAAETSLAFDPSGQPAISAWNLTTGASGSLLLVTRASGTWQTITVDTGGVGKASSLAFAPGGQPAIAYSDILNKNLKYARYNGSTWVLSTVDSAGSVGLDATLKFGPDGQPAIAHYDATNGDLRFTRYNGSTWTSAAVDTAGNVGSPCALSFGPDGQPAISYYDSTNADLKFARKGVFKPAP